MNLLEETLSVLSRNNKSPDNVKWVGSKDGNLAISWGDFVLISNINYSSDFGAAEIATDLVVVGKSWWLERGEYDNSEWWDFHECPVISLDHKPFQTVCNGEMWEDLQSMNQVI